MKKGKLILFGSLLVSSLSLSGCVLNILIPQQEDTIISDPSINVVSNLKLNLQGKQQKTIYPTLENSTLVNPVFDFVSSDTSIATVSSAGVVSAVSTGKCNVTVKLQSNQDITSNVSITVIDKEVEHYDYTIMYYMCGSDLEHNPKEKSDANQWYMSGDIKEILSAIGVSDSVRILIETGGTTEWALSSSYLEGATNISADKLQRWEVNYDTHKLHLVETLDTNEMAKEDSFHDFLSWGLDEYEADQMGVVLSGHGGGIAGCAYDDNYKQKYGNNYYPYTLQTFEIANAAKVALLNSNKDKFTWIGYDCCLMQCADIATINADYFDYMVASQESENATGWNHDFYLPYLANPSITPQAFLPKICDAFLTDNHVVSERNACLQTLSVLDLSKVNTLISSFDAIVPKLGTTSVAYSRVETAFKYSYNAFGEGMYGLCDFNSLLKQIKSRYGVDTTTVQQAVNNLVFYSKYCSGYSSSPCGVNAFFPIYVGKDKEYSLQVGREDYENKNSTKFVNWQALCLSGNDFGW